MNFGEPCEGGQGSVGCKGAASPSPLCSPSEDHLLWGHCDHTLDERRPAALQFGGRSGPGCEMDQGQVCGARKAGEPREEPVGPSQSRPGLSTPLCWEFRISLPQMVERPRFLDSPGSPK